MTDSGGLYLLVARSGSKLWRWDYRFDGRRHTLALGRRKRRWCAGYATMIFALYRMGYHTRATVHGFRGTASTILNEKGFNSDWIERQLAHVDKDQIRAAYNSAQWLSQRRGMMIWWADHIDRQRSLGAAASDLDRFAANGDAPLSARV